MAATATKAEIQQQLDWERVWRPRGGIAAILSAILALAGTAFSVTALADQPAVPILTSLTNLEQPGPIGATETVRLPLFEFYDDHKTDLLIGAILVALAAASAALALYVLMRATMLRNERFPQWSRYLLGAGVVTAAVGSIMLSIGTGMRIDDFLGSDRTVDGVDGIDQPPAFLIGGIGAQLGGMLLAVAYVITALNAMRAGLLPRTWGILGIFAGVMLVLPVAALSQLMQPIFLIALAIIFFGRYPRLAIPAWETGRAEPWPSAAADAQRKREARDRRKGIVSEPDPAPVERKAPAKPHSSSKKRKKRR